MSGSLKPDERCYFEMDEQQNCTYKVEFENKNKKVARSDEFTSTFTLNKDEIVNINILKDNKGKWSIILEK